MWTTARSVLALICTCAPIATTTCVSGELRNKMDLLRINGLIKAFKYFKQMDYKLNIFVYNTYV